MRLSRPVPVYPDLHSPTLLSFSTKHNANGSGFDSASCALTRPEPHHTTTHNLMAYRRETKHAGKRSGRPSSRSSPAVCPYHLLLAHKLASPTPPTSHAELCTRKRLALLPTLSHLALVLTTRESRVLTPNPSTRKKPLRGDYCACLSLTKLRPTTHTHSQIARFSLHQPVARVTTRGH